MSESKKPVSAEDLRKALAEVEAIVWATCESSSLGMEKMNELLHKFSVFQADYDKQVHVPRKEVEEAIKHGLFYILLKRLLETKDSCECPGCHQDFSACICGEAT